MILHDSPCVVLVMMGWVIITKTQRQTTWQSTIQIQSDGMRPVEPDDIALVFYIRIDNNSGQKMSGVQLQMKQCCIHRHDGETDCSSMRLMGDYLELLPNRQSAQLSMVFPTLYPMDLDGYCVVTVGSDESSPIQHTFVFNTLHQSQGFIKTVKASFGGESGECETVDLDPLRSCQPISCQQKYGGSRNYYNAASKLCEKPVPCLSTDDQALPDKVFLMNANRCERLEDKLDQSNLKEFHKDDVASVYEDYSDKHLVRYVCHHGRVKVNGEVGCECDRGWTSERIRTRGFVHNMCNVRGSTAPQPVLQTSVSVNSVVMVTTLGASCGLVFIVMIGLLLWFRWHKKAIDHRHHHRYSENLLRETPGGSDNAEVRRSYKPAAQDKQPDKDSKTRHAYDTSVWQDYTDADVEYSETNEESSFIN